MLDVPYVGSDVEASALCLDKLAFKRVLATPTACRRSDFADAARTGWRERAESFGLPLWVKPARLGSSVGITKVDAPEELDRAVEVAARHDPKVIVEASVPARRSSAPCSATPS